MFKAKVRKKKKDDVTINSLQRLYSIGNVGFEIDALHPAGLAEPSVGTKLL